MLNKKLLEKEYIKNKNSIRRISKFLNLPYTFVRNSLVKYKITIRSRSEALKNRTLSVNHKINLSKNHANVNGKNNPRWIGGIKNSNGYVYLYVSKHPRGIQNYVKRANLVMERYLGRYLKLKEVVHHINKIKTDDRIKNLMLFKNKSEHQRKAHKTKDYLIKTGIIIRTPKGRGISEYGKTILVQLKEKSK